MSLSPHLLDLLKIDEGSSEQDVEGAVEVLSQGLPKFLSEAGRQQLKKLHSSQVIEEFEIYPLRRDCPNWKYLIVQIGSEQSAELLQIPLDPLASDVPTTGERLLVRAWNSLPDFVDGDGNLKGGILLCAWQKPGLKEVPISNALVSIFNGLLPTSVALPFSKFDEAVSLTLPKSCLKPEADLKVKILTDCLLEPSLKWRFIGYYRVFEHEYLKNVYDKIQRDFFASPKDVIADAQNILNSEREQLINLIQERNITVHFEQIKDLFESALKEENRYCHALKRDIKNGGNLPRDAWCYGAVIFYKIRCSIVHAGASSVFLEKFEDSNSFLQKLIVLAEEAACALLDIGVHNASGEPLGDEQSSRDIDLTLEGMDTSCAMQPE